MVDPNQLQQRPHHFAIVDEVDSVLIDEARTPLIISGPVPQSDETQFEELKPPVEKHGLCAEETDCKFCVRRGAAAQGTRCSA